VEVDDIEVQTCL